MQTIFRASYIYVYVFLCMMICFPTYPMTLHSPGRRTTTIAPSRETYDAGGSYRFKPQSSFSYAAPSQLRYFSTIGTAAPRPLLKPSPSIRPLQATESLPSFTQKPLGKIATKSESTGDSALLAFALWNLSKKEEEEKKEEGLLEKVKAQAEMTKTIATNAHMLEYNDKKQELQKLINDVHEALDFDLFYLGQGDFIPGYGYKEVYTNSIDEFIPDQNFNELFLGFASKGLNKEKAYSAALLAINMKLQHSLTQRIDQILTKQEDHSNYLSREIYRQKSFIADSPKQSYITQWLQKDEFEQYKKALPDLIKKRDSTEKRINALKQEKEKISTFFEKENEKLAKKLKD